MVDEMAPSVVEITDTPVVEEKKEEEKKRFCVMDSSQIAMVATENEIVQARITLEKIKKLAFDINKQHAELKFSAEALAERRHAAYPLEYLLAFLDLAHQEKASHVTLTLSNNKPIQISFYSNNSQEKSVETVCWLAPRITDDSDD